MATEKTRPVSCRLSVENIEKLKGLLEERGISFREFTEWILSSVYTQNTEEILLSVKNSVNTVNTKGKKIKNASTDSVNTDSKNVNTLIELAKDLRMPFDDLINEIVNLVNDGSVMKEGKKLVAKENGVDLTGLFNACKQMKLQPQKVIDNTTQSIMKGAR